jgi:hypothetical protein
LGGAGGAVGALVAGRTVATARDVGVGVAAIVAVGSGVAVSSGVGVARGVKVGRGVRVEVGVAEGKNAVNVSMLQANTNAVTPKIMPNIKNRFGCNLSTPFRASPKIILWTYLLGKWNRR